MSEPMLVRPAVAAQLWGANSHVHKLLGLEGLDAAYAGERVGGAGHSVHQILQHMIYWHDISLRRLAGPAPPSPASAALGWLAPQSPATARRLAAAARG